MTPPIMRTSDMPNRTVCVDCVKQAYLSNRCWLWLGHASTSEQFLTLVDLFNSCISSLRYTSRVGMSEARVEYNDRSISYVSFTTHRSGGE